MFVASCQLEEIEFRNFSINGPLAAAAVPDSTFAHLISVFLPPVGFD